MFNGMYLSFLNDVLIYFMYLFKLTVEKHERSLFILGFASPHTNS